jgi:hypothetical protein
MQVQIGVEGGCRNAAPAALVKHKVKVWLTQENRSERDEGSITPTEQLVREIKEISVWRLTQDMDLILTAEEMIMVSTLDEADNVAKGWENFRKTELWVDTAELSDPYVGQPQYESWQKRGHHRRTIWYEPLVASDILKEKAQSLIQTEGILYLCASGQQSFQTSELKDVVMKQVKVTAEIANGISLSEWCFEYKHVPGKDKRSAAAKLRGAKKKQQGPPTERDLQALLAAMGRISLDGLMIEVKDAYGSSRFTSNQLRDAIDLMIPIQQKLGNPWSSLDNGWLQRGLIKAKRKAALQNGDEFMVRLFKYLDELDAVPVAK